MSEFAAGERVVILDLKKRRYLQVLKTDGEFHTHAGFVPHNSIIGQQEGCWLESTKGARYVALRPTLEDFVIEMPRGAQVIYPKDLAPICMIGDIKPGVRVFESGVGSGALSMTMLRWGASIVGYELREDFANRARANVESFLGADSMTRYDVRIRDSYDGVDEVGFDRFILDLPEPWHMIAAAERSLKPGGIFVAYTPSITQAASVRRGFSKDWVDTRTLEVLHQTWHIESESVRPDHRMVAHTGFLTVGRWIGQASMKMHSPGHSSADSITASS